MKAGYRTRSAWRYVVAAALVLVPAVCAAQLSLTTAVDLALKNSPKVKVAQQDVLKARAALSETRDAFVPVVNATAGVGKSSGPPLSVPVVFSVSAQSLAFNFSQMDYIRAARAGVDAAQLSLTEVGNEVAEDAASTYVALDNAQRRKAALGEALNQAARLVQIANERYQSGVDAHVEVSRAEITAKQMKLQEVLLEGEIENLATHLSHLTGMNVTAMKTVPDSIPGYAPSPAAYLASANDSPGIRAAFANALAKERTAHGDKRYLLLPQLAMGAEYSRITTAFTNYDLYYPAFNRNAENNENALAVGLQITLPLLDLMHRSKAKNSAAEAVRARYEAEDQRMQFGEGRSKLAHAVLELNARADLASSERDFAQDELEAVQLRLKADSGAGQGQVMTPKDEANARLQERQRYLDMLSADLQLRQTEILLMQQNGTLGDWLHNAVLPPATRLSNISTH